MGGAASKKWFYCAWEKVWIGKHINIKELFAIVTAIFTWGKGWRDLDIVMITSQLRRFGTLGQQKIKT